MTDAVRPQTSSAPPEPVEPGDADLMAWEDICAHEAYCGRWLALDAARYDSCGRATAGLVVDVDDDLHELCLRVREADRRNCAIVFCDPNRRSSVPN